MKDKLQTLYSQGVLQVPTWNLLVQTSTRAPGKTSSLRTEHTVAPLGSQSNTYDVKLDWDLDCVTTQKINTHCDVFVTIHKLQIPFLKNHSDK